MPVREDVQEGGDRDEGDRRVPPQPQVVDIHLAVVVRVHRVAEMTDVVRVVDRICQAQGPSQNP